MTTRLSKPIDFSFFFFHDKFLRSMTPEILSSLGYSNRKPNPSCLKQIQFTISHRKRLGGKVDSRDGWESRSPVSPKIPVLSFSPLHQLWHVDLLPGLGFLKITRQLQIVPGIPYRLDKIQRSNRISSLPLSLE